MTIHGFTLDAEEQTRLHEWMAEQNKLLTEQNKSNYEGASGGRFTYSFTPTSLGVVTKVQDDLTGNEIDLTDYSMW